MSTINSSLAPSTVSDTSLPSVISQNSVGFNVNDLALLLQEIMQKGRETGIKLATQQSINSQEMQKISVDNKLSAAKDTKKGAVATAWGSLGGAGLSLLGMGAVPAISKGTSKMTGKKNNGFLTDKMSGKINGQRDNLTNLNSGNKEADAYWSTVTKDTKANLELKPGRLKFDDSSRQLDASMKIRQESARVFDEFEKTVADMSLSPEQQKVVLKALDKKAGEFNHLNMAVNKLHPETRGPSHKMELVTVGSQMTQGIGNATGGMVSAGYSVSATESQTHAEVGSNNKSLYDQQRSIDADNLRNMLQKCIDSLRAMVDLHGAEMNAVTLK
ncbi:MAG TPA: hypothetical protein VGL07_13365 [Buttiauxella sp.]|jgi:hypothetical protein